MIWGRRKQDDFEDEIRSHLEMEAERLRSQGATDAEFAARRNFGNVSATMDRFDAAQPMSWAYDLGKDVRHAIRTLLRAPGFSAAVILTLALGIGANSAMFTIVNAVLFRPLPFPESDRVVSISRTDEGVDQASLDDATFRALAAGDVPGVQHVFASRGTEMQLTLPSGRQPVRGTIVTHGYFAVYRMATIRGRTFLPDEDRPGAPDVVVLSEEMWRTRFGADSAIVGQRVVLDNAPHTVIGVVPAVPMSIRRPQFWVPLRLPPANPASTWFLTVQARMRDGASLESVRAEVNTLGLRLNAERSAKHRAQETLAWKVLSLHERRYGNTRRPLLLLWGAVGVLLLIACANIANLSLARAARREREFSLRLALGASKARIVRYALCESLMLSAAGAMLGIAIAASTLGYFVRNSPGAVATASGIGLDVTALAFTLGIAVVVSLLFGLIPALRTAGAGVSFQFMSGTPRSTSGRREQWIRRGLIVAQLATALVMMTGASIVTKTLVRVTTIDAGFDAENLFAVYPSLGDDYNDARAQAFHDRLVNRLRLEPGVVSVGLGNASPLTGVASSLTLSGDDGGRTRMDMVAIDTAYFGTIGATLREGRAFTGEDRFGAPEVVIINEVLAKQLFPGRSAVGQPLHKNKPSTVVGVVRDIKHRGLEAQASAMAFFPIGQTPRYYRGVPMVRVASGASSFPERARRVIQQLDPAMASSVVSLTDTRDVAVAPRRFTALLASVFAGLATLLAIVGLYGVLSYVVTERTREIGIRVALGATPGRVLGFVMRSGVLLTAIGVGLGIGAASFVVRLLQTFVYDMSVYDPWMFGASAALLAVVALIASWIPARRAAAVDPVTALRIE
jgi:putative ABC transport system permease protein